MQPIKKRPTVRNALYEIIDICDEERVFEQGEIEEMLADKLVDIRAVAEAYQEQINNIENYCP